MKGDCVLHAANGMQMKTFRKQMIELNIQMNDKVTLTCTCCDQPRLGTIKHDNGKQVIVDCVDVKVDYNYKVITMRGMNTLHIDYDCRDFVLTKGPNKFLAYYRGFVKEVVS